MKKYIIFRILQQVPEPITLSVKKQKEYPIHEHYLTKVIETTLIYKYKPDSSLSEAKYIEVLQNHFKRKYNALKVDFGSFLSEENFLKQL